MNGVSNMLPFTVAGGIFIALAFLIDTIAGAPQDESFGTYTAAAAFFKTVGGFAFNFMVPVLAGYIGKSIADRPAFLVGLVGGYLATTGSTFASVAGGVPSGFLGALLAGFAGGFLMLGIEKLCDHMPRALNGIKPVLIYPLAGLGMIAVIMCAVNPFMGMINTGLSDFLNSMGSSSKIILGCILGGMMAIDMGGPFNKAAYVFGTAAIASGSYDIMAAAWLAGSHDRRHGSPDRNRTFDDIFQGQMDRGRAQERHGKLYHGTQLRHGGGDSLRGIRSAPRHSLMFCGRGSFRRAFHGV